MRSLNPKVLAIAAALIASSVAALAANTTFFTSIGDIAFPFTAPTSGGATPGTIDNMTIGATTPAPATFGALHLDNGTKTATATAGAATLNKNAGTITTESLTTAAAATYTLTITNSTILATDQVMASVQFGTSTTGQPDIYTVTPAAGSLVIVVGNSAASAAFNGTLKISFVRFAN
jgi:hypothetical protein